MRAQSRMLFEAQYIRSQTGDRGNRSLGPLTCCVHGVAGLVAERPSGCSAIAPFVGEIERDIAAFARRVIAI